MWEKMLEPFNSGGSKVKQLVTHHAVGRSELPSWLGLAEDRGRRAVCHVC